jgi:hypothetical protein
MKIDYERRGKKVTRAKPTTIKPHALLVCKGGAKTLRLPSYKQGFDHGAAPHMLPEPGKHYSLASNLLSKPNKLAKPKFREQLPTGSFK